MGRDTANYRLFWQEFRRTFQSTGAILPSGQALCRELSRYAAATDRPRRLVEIGPGTGVVTDAIIRRMGPDDRLDLVELNDRFVEALERRLKDNEIWKAAAPRIRIHHAPVERLAVDLRYEVLVSGLPFNNFSAVNVREILGQFEQIAAPGATLSFFEYLGIRRVKSVLVGAAERRRLSGVGEVLSEQFARRRFDRRAVLANVPPAWVHHLRYE
jgi:phospholipid N-methyltransferase